MVPELVPYLGTKPVPTGRNLHSSSQVHKTEITIKLTEIRIMGREHETKISEVPNLLVGMKPRHATVA